MDVEVTFVFYYIIALFVILLDQVTKWLIVKNMELGESIKVIENIFYITSHRNRGLAWGILQGQMWFFYVITVIVIIGLVIYIQKVPKGKSRLVFRLALCWAGRLGILSTGYTEKKWWISSTPIFLDTISRSSISRILRW